MGWFEPVVRIVTCLRASKACSRVLQVSIENKTQVLFNGFYDLASAKVPSSEQILLILWAHICAVHGRHKSLNGWAKSLTILRRKIVMSTLLTYFSLLPLFYVAFTPRRIMWHKMVVYVMKKTFFYYPKQSSVIRSVSMRHQSSC